MIIMDSSRKTYRMFQDQPYTFEFIDCLRCIAQMAFSAT